VAEAHGRAAGVVANRTAGLTHLAARIVRNRFAENVFALQYCAATTVPQPSGTNLAA
jgi:hypothetical protein